MPALRRQRGLVSPVAAQARHAHQRELAALSLRSEHLIADRSSHFPQLTQPQLVLKLSGRLIEKTVRPELVEGPARIDAARSP